MSFITAIGTAIPANVFSQKTLADFMVRAMASDEEDSNKLRTIFRASGIATRASVLPDYGKQHDFSFYSNTKNLEPFPSTRTRNDFYRCEAIGLSEQAVQAMQMQHPAFDITSVTHLITVSCTGFYAPGLDIDLIARLNLSPATHRTCINFMGCYAAISALKIADSICHSDSASKVLIVCTELCSLHFQKDPSADNFLANALFADGAAAVLVEGESTQSLCLEISHFNSMLIPTEDKHMAWNVGDFGFEMRLSSYVAEILEKHISTFCRQLFENHKLTIDKVKYLAVHPGGKKILTTVEKSLQVSKQRNAVAYQVLKKYGNMSSPTVLFVLKGIVEQLKKKDRGERIAAMAFGPGLTLEGAVFKIIFR